MSVLEASKEFKQIEIPLKLDFGCGKAKKEGFKGVDIIKFEGVDAVTDLRARKWHFEEGALPHLEIDPLEYNKWILPDNSVDEAHASHFIEHLTAQERVFFMNELYRVLKPEAKFNFACPHWSSSRAYGDPTHQWPPIGEFWLYYLQKDWRKTQAPHTDIEFNPDGYNCNFDSMGGFTIAPHLMNRNQEYIQFAQQNYKESCPDIFAMLTKKV